MLPKTIGIYVLLLSLLIAYSTEERAAPGTVLYTLPGQTVYPEGIAYDPQTSNFFVGSTDDGTIYRSELSEREASVFLSGNGERDEAAGLSVDAANRRLWVAGGSSQRIFAYNVASGELIKAYQAGEENGLINDVTTDSEGNAYFTNSSAPTLYRVPNTPEGPGELEVLIDLSDTLSAPADFNLNGTVVTPDDRYLIVAHSGVNKLYRVTLEDLSIAEIETSEAVGGTDWL